MTTDQHEIFQDMGLGARLSIHPHVDDFVPVILGALADAEPAADGLEIRTDDVSTYIGVPPTSASAASPEQRLQDYLTRVLAAAAARAQGGHVVGHLLLSRGCPGETGCTLHAEQLPPTVQVDATPVGVPVAAHWSLYPLADDGDHMREIMAAIDAASRRGTKSRSEHYVTRLSGDLADVLATVIDAWAAVGASVQHVTSHVTISIASPSTNAAEHSA
jgi:pectin methylesterase-like acyl-CoA thioesterase